MAELTDASALLWRLQLRNIEVSGRCQRLADRWEVQTLAGARPFYVVHATMAFVAAGRAVAAARVLPVRWWRSAQCKNQQAGSIACCSDAWR
jgi:hypothetical protein